MLFRIARIAPLALALAFAFTAQASAASNVYLAVGTGDAQVAPCQELAVFEGFAYFRCDSVRAAVDAANAHANAPDDGGDLIYLQSDSPYTVNSPLTLTEAVTIVGRGPRTTTVRGAGSSRVFTVAAGVEAYLYRMTIAGGNAFPADGGNILNQGDLLLLNARVTGGTARRGGGIANTSTGTLLVVNSLIDRNAAISLGTGGGIFDEGDLTINNSTIAFNQASRRARDRRRHRDDHGRRSVRGDDRAQHVHRTARRGSAGGSADASTSTGRWSPRTAGRPTLANCSGIINDDDLTNLADDGCFEITGNPGLSTELVNRGGDTDVLTITPGGAAKDFVTPCIGGNDQRNAPRDAARHLRRRRLRGGRRGAADRLRARSRSRPRRRSCTPPVFTPPTAGGDEPRADPGGQQDRRGEGDLGAGADQAARARTGSSNSTRRRASRSARRVDTKQGVVELTVDPEGGRGAGEGAVPRRHLPAHPDARDHRPQAHRGAPRARSAAPAPPQKKPKRRKLWGKGTGKFRTTGNYSAATVRGTEWLVQDTLLRHAHARHPGRRRRPRQGQEEDDPRARAARALHGQAAQVTRRPLAVAIALAGLAVPASAQRGDVHRERRRPTGATCTARPARCAARSLPRRRTAPARTTRSSCRPGRTRISSPLTVDRHRGSRSPAPAPTRRSSAPSSRAAAPGRGPSSQLEVRDVTHPGRQRGRAGGRRQRARETSAPRSTLRRVRLTNGRGAARRRTRDAGRGHARRSRQSLIDTNFAIATTLSDSGGGLLHRRRQPRPRWSTIEDSTITLNRAPDGAGIGVQNNTGQPPTLRGVTLARNTRDGPGHRRHLLGADQRAAPGLDPRRQHRRRSTGGQGRRRARRTASSAPVDGDRRGRQRRVRRPPAG